VVHLALGASWRLRIGPCEVGGRCRVPRDLPATVARAPLALDRAVTITEGPALVARCGGGTARVGAGSAAPRADVSKGTPRRKASVTESASVVLGREDAMEPPGGSQTTGKERRRTGIENGDRLGREGQRPDRDTEECGDCVRSLRRTWTAVKCSPSALSPFGGAPCLLLVVPEPPPLADPCNASPRNCPRCGHPWTPRRCLSYPSMRGHVLCVPFHAEVVREWEGVPMALFPPQSCDALCDLADRRRGRLCVEPRRR
jgi:hypothetical protein